MPCRWKNRRFSIITVKWVFLGQTMSNAWNIGRLPCVPSKLKSIGLLNLTGRKYSAKQPKAKAWKTFCSHWKQNMVSWPVQLWPILILNRVVLSEKSTTGKTNSLPILRLVLAALNAVLPVPVRLCWSPALSSRAAWVWCRLCIFACLTPAKCTTNSIMLLKAKNW